MCRPPLACEQGESRGTGWQGELVNYPKTMVGQRVPSQSILRRVQEASSP